MAEYIVTDPQTGRKVRLTGDSPPTEQELNEIFASIPDAQPTSYAGPETLLSNSLQDPEIARMSIPERMQRGLYGGDVAGALYGAAKPFIGVAQLGMAAGERLFGVPEGRVPLSQRVSSALQSFEQKREEAGGSVVPEMAGQMIPFSRAISSIPPARGFIGRTGQAIAGGALSGVVEPVTSPEADFGAAKTSQIGTGAIVAPVTSLLGTGVTQLGRRFLPSGIDTEAGLLANELAGNRQQQIVQQLRSQQPRNAAPITAPQAAVSAGSAEFSALGERASQVRPSEFQDIAQAQNQARAQELARIAGTPEDIAAAERSRAAATAPLYAAARGSQIPVDSLRTIRLVDRIAQSAQGRPKVTSVLNGVRQTMMESYPYQDRARDSWNAVRQSISSYSGNTPAELEAARRILYGVKNFDLDQFTAIARLKALRPQDQAARDQINAAITNLELPEEVVTQNANQLINARRNISDLLEERDLSGKKVNQEVSRELRIIQRSLDNQIARSAPEFKQAQSLFADLSKPIDRMRVGQYIQDRLIPAINDAGADAPQRATVFANAMRDMTESVRLATNYKRSKGLADLMTPDEMDSLNRIGADLARDVDLRRLSGAGQRRATEAVGELFSEQSANTLSRPIMILNAILRRTGASASERTMNALAEKMQNPAAMADIMDKATAAERRAIERGIMLYLTSGAVSSPDDAAGWAARAAGAAGDIIGVNISQDQAGAQ